MLFIKSPCYGHRTLVHCLLTCKCLMAMAQNSALGYCRQDIRTNFLIPFWCFLLGHYVTSMLYWKEQHEHSAKHLLEFH